jgi:sulfate transport system substrate-binding protein
MEITLNNQKQEIPEGTLLSSLVAARLAELRMGPEMITVALNGTIIPREELPQHLLAPGDVVEYLFFMGGGSLAAPSVRARARRRMGISLLLAAALALGAGASVQAKPAPVEFTLASCCVTEEVMRRALIPGFTAYWKEKTGRDVTINATFAGSGTLKNQILGGTPVQVGIFSSELYPESLKEKGLITAGWQSAKNHGVVARSVIVAMVREKNPKKIRGFADLAKPGIQVIHSSPATSGGAQWAIYSIYGSALKENGSQRGKGDKTAAERRLAAVEQNVIAMPESAAQAMAQFKAGFGDALVTYENEVLFELGRGEKYTLVVPKSTITTEWVATPIDKNVKPEQKEVVEGFLAYLQSEAAQKAFAKYGFRSVIPAVTKANQNKYADVELPFELSYLGGPKAARREIIDGYWTSLSAK